MSSPSALQQTPLYDVHVDLGARMKPFGGFDMPVQYESIIDEHMAVREAAGLFDVSHMGEVLVEGPEAFAFVQGLVTNDASQLYDGKAMYTVMCQPDGGIVDDLITYRLAADRYLLVINAANIEQDIEWMRQNNKTGAQLTDRSSETALLALQGPKSFAIAQQVLDLEGVDLQVEDLQFYHFQELPSGAFLGCDWALVSYTGYTGEKGLELYCPADRAAALWERLMEAGTDYGLAPAGLGARDTLRLEAGYCLYGSDITTSTNPYEAGLGWIVKLDVDEDFIGRETLVRIKKDGPDRKLIGFVMDERGIPRPDYSIEDDQENEIGKVTSGSQSPVLKQGIGLGYVPNEPRYREPGTTLYIRTRGRALPATVRKPPFHKN